METKKIAYAALGMLVGGVLVLGAGVFASRGGIEFDGGFKGMHRFGSGSMMGDRNFTKKITKSVTNTDSGAEITLTTTDSGALARLKEMETIMKNKMPFANAKVTITTHDLNNGIKVTVFSTDADTVKKIQTFANDNRIMFGLGGGFGMMKDFGSGSLNKDLLNKVTKTVNNLSNGAEVTLTTTDSGALAKLQDMALKFQQFKANDTRSGSVNQNAPARPDISVVNLDNGIKVVVTSPDAATVKRIQKEVSEDKGFGFFLGGKGKGEGRGRGPGGMMKGFWK